jgi:hypothetical protein
MPVSRILNLHTNPDGGFLFFGGPMSDFRSATSNAKTHASPTLKFWPKRLWKASRIGTIECSPALLPGTHLIFGRHITPSRDC